MNSDLGGPDGEGKQKLSRWQIGNGSLSVLEQVYQMDPFPGLDARRELAKQLSVSPRQVQVWFQNKRQRERKISRQKGLLSTPGLPDTPAAQAAQAAKVAEQATAMVHVAQLGNGEAAGGSCLLQPGTSADGAANAPGCAQPSAGAPAAAVGLAPAQLQQPGGSSGAGEPGTSGSCAGDGAASSMQQQPSAPPDFLFGLPMSRAVSNPAIGKLEGGIARSVSAGHDLYIGGAADPDLSKEATDRLGVSPLKQQRTAQRVSGLPMSRSMCAREGGSSGPRGRPQGVAPRLSSKGGPGPRGSPPATDRTAVHTAPCLSSPRRSLDASLLNHGGGRMDGPLGIGRTAS